MTFRDWLNKTFYEGFDTTDLTDEEYYELEDQYRKETQSIQWSFLSKKGEGGM